MRKVLPTLLFVLALAVSMTAQITVPFTFTAGTVISPDQMNANFAALTVACNRSGCTMSGVLRALAGSAAAPGIANVTDPTTGLVIGASSTIGMSLAGVQRWLLDSNGLTVFGTNIINNTGKIPALSTTYFTSVSGANLTGLNATQLTTGTVPNAAFPATLPAANGSALTALNASQLTTGTVPNTQLPAQSAFNYVPAGAVMSFNLGSCPAGWAEYTAARGLYIVGLQNLGTLNGGAAGQTPLSNTEARATGSHTHTITDPTHTHTITDPTHAHTVPERVLRFGGGGSDVPAPSTAGAWILNEATTASLTGISGANAASTGITGANAAGTGVTNAPYIQLLMCQKS